MLLYGRGTASVAEQIGESVKDAQVLVDKFFQGFPKLKTWMDKTVEFAREHGYVEDVVGRRRRLPDIQLPKYQVNLMRGVESDALSTFNPLLGTPNFAMEDDSRVKKYKKLCESIRSQRDYESLKSDAAKNGVEIRSNTGFISQAERQSVNCVDASTEILTQDGWKTWKDIKIGEKIYSLNVNTGKIEDDIITNVFTYTGEYTCIKIKHKGFESISTLNHRWPTYSLNYNDIKFLTTEQLSKHTAYGNRKIIKAADNDFNRNEEWSDDMLYILGMWLTDGYCRQIPNATSMSNRYACQLYQKKPKIKENIREALDSSNIPYTETEKDGGYSTFYILQPFSNKLGRMFPNRLLTYAFINTLSQTQADMIIKGMLDGDGWDNYIIITNKERLDLLQYLIVRAGKASSYYQVDHSGMKSYSDKIHNKLGYIETKNPYYVVTILNRKRAEVLNKNCTTVTEPFVWCVTTNNHTWIARSGSGYTFITGNSVVQGSASTLTKTAMIAVHNDKQMRELGFRMLISVHDEIIGECPKENADEAAKRLSEIMIESAKPLCSVPMKCDCYEVSRWYEDDFSDYIHEKYSKLITEDGISQEDAIAHAKEDFPQINPEYIEEMVLGTYECNVHSDI